MSQCYKEGLDVDITIISTGDAAEQVHEMLSFVVIFRLISIGKPHHNITIMRLSTLICQFI